MVSYDPFASIHPLSMTPRCDQNLIGTMLVFALLCAACGAAVARTVDPYVGQVPVADGTEASLQQAFDAAFIQVMEKVSGAPDQVQALVETQELGDGRGLVLQHGFVKSPLIADPGLRMVQVRFGPAQINARIRQLGLPFWPPERPETIVWMAQQREGQRQLLGLAAEDDALKTQITAAGEYHGVPLVLPLLDLEDQSRVTATDVWGGLADRVVNASQRYGAAQVLLGRLFSLEDGRWSIRWTLSGDRYNEGWTSGGQTPTEAISGGVAEMARRMGRRFALRSGETGGERTIMLRIQGVRDASVYGGVMRYLRGLSVVASVDPVQVSGDVLDLRVAANTGVRGLVQVVETGQILRVVNGLRQPGIDLLVEPGG